MLPIRTAQPILPTITTAFNFIDNGIVDYNQSIAGSLIVELSGWISCWQFCYAYISYLGWRFLMMSLSGSLAYFSNGYYQDITSPTICCTNRRKLQIFNSTYGYDPFVAVDQQYLYFAGLMLSCTVSYLFSCNAKWQVYMRNICKQYEEILRLPGYLITSASPLWPPDGFIMATLVLFFILGFHFILLVFGVCFALFSRMKKLKNLVSVLFQIIITLYGRGGQKVQ